MVGVVSALIRRLVRRAKYCAAVERPRAVGAREARIEIVKQNKIEVGARGHFAAAQLSEREHRRFGAAQAAVDLAKSLLDLAMQRADDDVGERRIGFPRLTRRQDAGENSNADENHLLAPESAGAVENFLLALGFGKEGIQALGQDLFARRSAEETGIEQAVEQGRRTRDDFSEPRRRAENHGEKTNEIGVRA